MYDDEDDDVKIISVKLPDCDVGVKSLTDQLYDKALSSSLSVDDYKRNNCHDTTP
jgi:hypothetical protein